MFLSASQTVKGTGIRSDSHVTVTGVGSHSRGNGGGGEKDERFDADEAAGLSPTALLLTRVVSKGFDDAFGDVGGEAKAKVGERRTRLSLRRVHLLPSAVKLAFLFYQRNFYD